VLSRHWRTAVVAGRAAIQHSIGGAAQAFPSSTVEQSRSEADGTD
jgi:hypothetical protein